VATDRWQRLESIFHRAADLAPAERQVLLDAECGDDVALRAEVEQLLRGDATGDDAFSRLEAHTRAGTDPLLGRRLGVYELKARLAQGGMGVVYRAERIDGLFQQEVAIKLIRADGASDWMLRRFEFERRTLAALQHPGIARLHDGGSTAEGFPYFVMELVRGEPIDRYCERERLPMAARLRLFLQVCRAVHFAHQNLVVHCDLKPANVLIDDRGVPRLLDFGIARLLESAPDGVPAAATRTVSRLLTPEYASPEQLAGGAVTTAHDVYALGVVLYELATGRRPFEPAGTSAVEWERTVRERSPERPSTRALRVEGTHRPDTVAASFRTSPAGLRRALRGDLDRIVLMALRKEPERRYASVQEFADDVERHLAGRPVRAHGNSLGYLAAKFVRRNRVAVASAAAVLLALLFGLFAARRGERIAQAEAEHATMEADSFQGIADFLMDAFLPTQPAEDPAWQQRARERVLAHAARVHRQHADSDHVRGNLLDTLGKVAMRLNLHDEAAALMAEAHDIRTRAFGPSSIEAALSLRSLGQLQFQLGDHAAAARLFEAALPIHRAAPDATHADVAGLANDLATCLRNLGRGQEAASLHQEALALRRDRGARTLQVAESLNNLAAVHLDRGELDLALEQLREALTIRSAILGDDHPLTVQGLSNLALVLWRHGDQDEALATMARAEAGYRAIGPDGEDGLGLVLANLATMQTERRDLDAAAATFERALALQRKSLGAEHPATATTLARLAVLQHMRHRDDEARATWTEVVAIRRRAGAPRDLAAALHGQSVFLFDCKEHDAAIPLLEEAVALHRAMDAPDQAALGRAEQVLGRCLARNGAFAAAREHLRAAVAALEGSPLVGADERTRAHEMLAEVERRAGG
jgi:serine/threonine protein kinase